MKDKMFPNFYNLFPLTYDKNENFEDFVNKNYKIN